MSLAHASSLAPGDALRRSLLSAVAKSLWERCTWRGKETSDFVFEIVIPAHGLLFRPIGVHDGLVVDAVFPDRVFLRFFHDFAARMRRTEVRPIPRRRAISALLTPARYSFRISVA